MVGSPYNWDFLKYKKDVVLFHSLVNNKCIDYFVEVYTTYKLLLKYSLYYCPLYLIDKIILDTEFFSKYKIQKEIDLNDKLKSTYRKKLNLINNKTLNFINLEGIEKLFIIFNNVYYKERALPLCKGNKGCIIHVYSTMIKNNSFGNTILRTKRVISNRLKAIKQRKTSCDLHKYIKGYKNNIFNNKNFQSIFNFNSDIKINNNVDKNYLNNKININYSNKDYNIYGKRLLTVFQIKNNEYNFFYEVTKYLLDYTKDAGKVHKNSMFTHNYDVYVEKLKLQIYKYIENDYADDRFNKVPFNKKFYYKIINNSFSLMHKRAVEFYNTNKFNKKVYTFLENIVKEVQLCFKINYPGFTSHIFRQMQLNLIETPYSNIKKKRYF